ncbi:Crp/Fnr family transcriptional regulator [Solidesulfovibrio alcoholivorans]|uniref:Crp/Fnr family transcriptional regulator n=1 Tax=Solidesulfovibrio alcoholivorans TaxID=81406 RepID=UPI000498412B|nr:Crp/Fnr family transcriptional regulator [Solidesulfovibrio alcoholivorans]
MDQTARMILLRSLPLFGGMPEARLQTLAANARATRYAPGALLAVKEQAADVFHCIATGQAKVYRAGPDGREQTLFLLGPGEPFCLCTLVDSASFPAFAAALAETLVLEFPTKALAEAIQDSPQAFTDLMRLMCGRFKEAMAMIESLALRDLPGRVAVFLLHEAGRALSGDLVRLSISQREVAKIVGATPEALSRALKKLAEAGHVVVRGRKIEIRDRAGLEAAAAGNTEG